MALNIRIKYNMIYPRLAGQYNARLPIFDHIHIWFNKWPIMAGICSLFQLFPEIICSFFFIISHQTPDLNFSKSSVWKRKKKVKWQRLRSRADLNRRPLAQESSVYSPGLTASWRMQVEKDRWNHFGARHRLPIPALRLHYAQTQSFRFALFE